MEQNNLFVTDPQLQEWISAWPEIRSIYAGRNLLAGLDNQGELHYRSESYLRYNYWNDLIMLAVDKYLKCVLFGLKSDGTCVISKDPFAGGASSFLFPQPSAPCPKCGRSHSEENGDLKKMTICSWQACLSDRIICVFWQVFVHACL